MERADIINAEDRARIYALLAEVFSSVPTEESTSAVCRVAEALGISCPDGLSLGAIEQEFMNLLVVPNPRYVAPYESAYRDHCVIPGPDANPRPIGGLLMGESTAEVKQCFVDAGIRPSRDLPDHVANELRLVAHLCHVESRASGTDAIEAGRQRECFVAEHLLRWIGELATKIVENSGTGFYRTAIDVAHVMLRAECPPEDLKHAAERIDEPSAVR